MSRASARKASAKETAVATRELLSVLEVEAFVKLVGMHLIE